MITIKNVSYSYPDAEQPVLSNLSLDIQGGEFTLVTGQSGSGKSTLLRCLNGLVPHFSGGLIRGEIRVNGIDPVKATPQTMSQHVGFVFQDPEAQFVVDTVEDEIAFALENIALPRPEMRLRVEEVLDLLDLVPLRERHIGTLSGGEKQRVAIASALALRPSVLILDEPTSQLDPKSAEDVLNALVRLNQDLGLTILLAEHRLERVIPFVDKVIHLQPAASGVFSGTPREVLTQVELAPPVMHLAKTLGWQPLPLTVKEAWKFKPSLPTPKEKSAPGAIDQSKEPPFIQAQSIWVEYHGQPALRGVDFDIRRGEIVALMGRNGAGKTTLLRSIVGLVAPQRGQIWVAGETTRGKDVTEICRQVAYLPQDPNALLFSETVEQEFEQTLKNHALPLDPQRIAAMLVRLGLQEKVRSYPRDLSTGERQRVALGTVAITQPQGLLLDEPTRGLDYTAKAELTELLSTWRDQGMAIVLVTHDVEFAAGLADRVVLLSRGEVIACGAAAEVLTDSPMFAPQIARLFPNRGWLTVKDVLGTIKQ
jgi:energy-coupling factor transport system ATP-binding protein